MSNFNIAVTPGDYVGPEVVAEARKVLDAIGRRFGHTFTYKRSAGRRRCRTTRTASTCRSRRSTPAPRPTRSSRGPLAARPAR